MFCFFCRPKAYEPLSDIESYRSYRPRVPTKQELEHKAFYNLTVQFNDLLLTRWRELAIRMGLENSDIGMIEGSNKYHGHEFSQVLWMLKDMGLLPYFRELLQSLLNSSKWDKDLIHRCIELIDNSQCSHLFKTENSDVCKPEDANRYFMRILAFQIDELLGEHWKAIAQRSGLVKHDIAYIKKSLLAPN